MEAFNRTGGSGSSEVQARRERLQFDLWKVLDEFLYGENVRQAARVWTWTATPMMLGWQTAVVMYTTWSHSSSLMKPGEDGDLVQYPNSDYLGRDLTNHFELEMARS